MKEKIYTVDRIEEKYAICEDKATKEMIKIEIEKLPMGIKEGSVIKDSNGTIILDKEEEKEKRSIIEQKMDKLWKKQRKS